VPSLVDYDPLYRRGERLFGPPLRALTHVLADLPPSTLLDLGCGQGRNALCAARRGHTVVGVDLAGAGVAQMLADARAERLPVQGVVGDLLAFRSRRKFDLVLLDRVLPYLPDDNARLFALTRLGALTRRGGLTLVTMPPRHRALVHGFFAHSPLWQITRQQAGLICARRARRF
jgi:trans-aconitate methyltransferase